MKITDQKNRILECSKNHKKMRRKGSTNKNKKYKRGVGGPPPLANAVLTAWVWKGLVCVEASLPGFKKRRRSLSKTFKGHLANSGFRVLGFFKVQVSSWV